MPEFIDGEVSYDAETKYMMFLNINADAKLSTSNTQIRPSHRNVTVEKINFIGTNRNTNLINYLPVKVDQVFINLKDYKVTFGSMKEVGRENFQNLYKLKVLNIQGNSIELSVKENSFDDLRSLLVCDINTNRMTKLPKNIFKNNKKLEIVNLASNRLTTLSQDIFQNLSELRKIYLDFNRLYSLPQDVFKGLHKLLFLNLSQNQLKSIPEMIFEDLTELRVLAIHSNQLKAFSEKIFLNNDELEMVHLGNNGLTSLSYRNFENKLNLKCVILDRNYCIDKIYGDEFNPMILTQYEKDALRNDLQSSC